MDGSFACPECGSSVEVGGLAPGRQVRCGFCDRLLEVPYLPRAAGAAWRRRRFGRPKWLIWAWAGLAVAAIAIVLVGTFRFVKRQYNSAQERSIKQLLESSREHEAEGRLDQALIDFDAAIEMARKAGPGYLARLNDVQMKRPVLARREAEAALDRLRRLTPLSFPLGNWLNLVARSQRDPDLAPLVSQINKHYQTELESEVTRTLAAARHELQAERVGVSMVHCDRIAGLIGHLRSEKQLSFRSEAEEIVSTIASTYGVMIDPPQGNFVFGSQRYVDELVPVLVKGLEVKGYLPCRGSSPWHHQWKHALYHAQLTIDEDQEGSYLSSANRLTRIEARLTLTSRGQTKWHTTPTARSTVPLPKLPAYLASRAAMKQERSEELEKLFYDDAKAQIRDKFAHALSNMPGCPAPQAGGGS